MNWGSIMQKTFSALVRVAPFLLLTTCTFPAALAQAQVFQDAKLDFDSRRYHAAADEFSKVIKQNPSNAEAYLWLGRSLAELKDGDGAKTMYEAAFKLDPFGQTGRQARSALMDLETRRAMLTHPTDGAKITADTVGRINAQANDLRRLKMRDGNIGAQQSIYSGNGRVARLGYDQPMTIDNLRDPNANFDSWRTLQAIKEQVRNGTGWDNRLSANPRDFAAGNVLPNNVLPNNFAYRLYRGRDVSNLRLIDSSWQRGDSLTQAMGYQSQALKQAVEVQNSANDLQRLLAEPQRESAVHLRALGTSLYVRNYSPYDADTGVAADPPLELKATAKKWTELPAGKPKG